ncbi:MAG TPA: hypothetical protein VFN31_03055 [Candidatus Saccharimonadales bacterium]|nr:hypothetical protein [Candidatus Saccharimonadales bacterium]
MADKHTHNDPTVTRVNYNQKQANSNQNGQTVEFVVNPNTGPEEVYSKDGKLYGSGDNRPLTPGRQVFSAKVVHNDFKDQKTIGGVNSSDTAIGGNPPTGTTHPDPTKPVASVTLGPNDSYLIQVDKKIDPTGYEIVNKVNGKWIQVSGGKLVDGQKIFAGHLNGFGDRWDIRGLVGKVNNNGSSIATFDTPPPVSDGTKPAEHTHAHDKSPSGTSAPSHPTGLGHQNLGDSGMPNSGSHLPVSDGTKPPESTHIHEQSPAGTLTPTHDSSTPTSATLSIPHDYTNQQPETGPQGGIGRQNLGDTGSIGHVPDITPVESSSPQPVAVQFTDHAPQDLVANTQSITVTTAAGHEYTEFASAQGIQMANNQLSHYEAAQSDDTKAAMIDQSNIDADKTAITDLDNKMRTHPTSGIATELQSQEDKLYTDKAALSLDNAKENAATVDVQKFTSAVTTLQGMYNSEQAQATQESTGASTANATQPTNSQAATVMPPVTNPNAPTFGSATTGTSPSTVTGSVANADLTQPTNSQAATVMPPVTNPNAPTFGSANSGVEPTMGGGALTDSTLGEAVKSPENQYLGEAYKARRFNIFRRPF